ncbi:hypothetical protein H0H87_011146, partial [Tephrocybe sp. NHM501043]
PAMLRIKRKPSPTQSLGLDLPELNIRYPTPDPADPFAPLWVLHARGSNASLKADALKANTLKANVSLKATVLDAQPHHSTPPSVLFAATHDTPSSFIHISHISSPSLAPEADDVLTFTDPRPAPSHASHTLTCAQL